jgi:hypothetical protein
VVVVVGSGAVVEVDGTVVDAGTDVDGARVDGAVGTVVVVAPGVVVCCAEAAGDVATAETMAPANVTQVATRRRPADRIRRSVMLSRAAG